MAENTRRVEVLVNGYWEPTEFSKLEECDCFRLFEEDGSEVDHGQICVATSRARQDGAGVWGIGCQPAGQHRLPANPKEGMVAWDDDRPVKFRDGEWVGANLARKEAR